MPSLEEQIEQLQLALERCRNLNKQRQKKYRENRKKNTSNKNYVDVEEESEEEKAEMLPYDLSKHAVITIEDIRQAFKAYPFTSQASRRSYRSHFNTLHKMLKYNNYRTGVLNVNQNLDKLFQHPGADNSKKAYMQVLLWAIDHFNIPFDRKLKEKYNDYFSELKIMNMDRVDLEKETIKLTKYSIYLQRVLEEYGADSQEYLYARMFDEISCRDDYGSLVVCNTPQQIDLNDTTKNFILVPNMQGTQATYYLNNYKTINSYGKYVSKFSKETSDLIRQHLDHYDFEYGKSFLFHKGAMSGWVGKLNRSVGIDGAIGLLRKMKISEESSKKPTPRQRLDLSKKMQHSVTVQAAVYKRQIEEEE